MCLSQPVTYGTPVSAYPIPWENAGLMACHSQKEGVNYPNGEAEGGHGNIIRGSHAKHNSAGRGGKIATR